MAPAGRRDALAVRTRVGAAAVSGAPHTPQNAVPGAAAAPHRPQVGSESDALRRRPQCGQKGSRPGVQRLQNGQVLPSVAAGSLAAGAGAAPVVAAIFTTTAEPRGFPQSMQNLAPTSLPRPQYVHTVKAEGAPQGA